MFLWLFTGTLLVASGASAWSAASAPISRAPVVLPERGQGASVETTEDLRPQGGVAVFPSRDRLWAGFEYGPNDGFGAHVRLRNDGSRNALGVPIPQGVQPLLFLPVRLGSLRPVTLNPGDHHLIFQSYRPWPNVQYGVLVYAGKTLMAAAYGAARPSPGTLSFASPLDGVTLAPAAPLTIELVACKQLPPAVQQWRTALLSGVKSHKSTTVALKGSAGAFALPSFGGFKGSVTYNANDAQSGAMLTFTNSGANNLLGAPEPPNGTAVLYLEASISGASDVAFASGANKMVVSSSSFIPGAAYAIDAYVGNQEVLSYAAGVPKGKKLTFQTPLSGVSITSGAPLAIELVVLSAATPTPSPSPTPSPTPSATPTASPTPTATPYPQTLYVTYLNQTQGGVYLYDGDNPGPPNNFFSLPEAYAVAVDDVQNLYVSQLDNPPNNDADIEELYPLGNGAAYYTDVMEPSAIAVGAGSSAFMDVANGEDRAPYGEYGLLTFPQGVNQPSEFSDPNLAAISAVAVDAASNGYVGGITANDRPEVDFLETNVGTFNLGLQLDSSASALALDPAGNLIVAEEGTGVAVFAPGTTEPYAWFDQGGDPISFVLGNGGRWLYVLNFACPSSSCFSAITIYAYPQGTLLGHYPNAAYPAYGIAVSPRVPLFNPDVMKRRHPHFRYWSDVANRRAGSPGRR